MWLVNAMVNVDTATINVPVRITSRRPRPSMTRPSQGLTEIDASPATPTISPILTSSAPSSSRYPGK